MKVTELREKSVNELHSLLRERSQEQFNLRMQKGAGEMPKPHQLKKLRREIGQINTLISEKERQA